MRDRSGRICKLLKHRNSRESYIRSKLNVLIPSQLRALRLRQELTQQELADEADMKQSRISAMERPGETQFNIETLVRLAAALRVALRVEFVPYSELLRWENDFSQDAFTVTKIDDDGTFLNPSEVAHAISERSQITITVGDFPPMTNAAPITVTFGNSPVPVTHAADQAKQQPIPATTEAQNQLAKVG